MRRRMSDSSASRLRGGVSGTRGRFKPSGVWLAAFGGSARGVGTAGGAAVQDASFPSRGCGCCGVVVADGSVRE